MQDECDDYATRTESYYGMWGGYLRSRGNHKRPQPVEPEEYVIPNTLSASSIQTYLTCPARWRAEYLEKARMPSGSAASLGTACHTAFEVWVADGHYQNPALDTHPKRQAVMKGIYDEGYWREFADADRYAEGWGLVDKWLQRQDWTDIEVISTESKESFIINTTAGPMQFNYIMDRLDRHADGTIEVVDYKSLFMPLSPQELKGKPQVRVYALAAQIKYPEAERIWVTFDMLRYDPIGVVFTKEENRASWDWLRGIAQRIVDDEDPAETLSDDCRWCIRKDSCGALERHRRAGGPLGITDPAEAAEKHLEISRALGALKVQQTELESMLMAHMREHDELELPLGDYEVAVTISARRSIDDGRVRAVVGDTLMAEYGSMTMGKVDAMLKDERLTAQQKQDVKKLIGRSFGEPSIKVKEASPF